MSSIGPHGKCCESCYGTGKRPVHYAAADFGKACMRCHGTGRACPGGPVRLAFYEDARPGDHGIWVCQTCGCIVPAEAVRHD